MYIFDLMKPEAKEFKDFKWAERGSHNRGPPRSIQWLGNLLFK